jgi:hypothetical protein
VSVECRLTMRELGPRWDVAAGTRKVSLMRGFILTVMLSQRGDTGDTCNTRA